MFTGIIEGLGKVVSLLPHADGKTLTLTLPFKEDGLTIGQSLAVNGVCLTLASIGKKTGIFDLSLTTLNHTNLGILRPGDLVNLERPLRLNQELGGHLVTGHVDVTSPIEEIKGRQIRFSIPEAIRGYVVSKGSVAIDGISLTIASIEERSFWVTIIPHTWKHTNLKKRRKGDRVNLETDLIAKYVDRLLKVRPFPWLKEKKRGLTKENLNLSGFLYED
jgi:riboflavin synthase